MISLSNLNQEEYFLRNIFRKFDVNDNGMLTIEELAGLVSVLGIKINDVDLIAIMRELDCNKKGYLEFEDFT